MNLIPYRCVAGGLITVAPGRGWENVRCYGRRYL